MIAVRPYTPDEAECWNELVAQSRNGTFLFDRRYMDYHSDRFADHSLLFSERGKTMALLPANRCGDTLHSHQGLTYGGLVMSQGVTTAKACEIFTELNKYLCAEGIKKVVYKAVPHIYHRYPAEEDLYALVNVCGARLCVRHMSSTLLMDSRPRLTESRRSGLRKALHEGLTVTESTDMRAFWHILDTNLEQKYQAHPVHTTAELELLHSRFPEKIRLYMVFDGSTPLGGALLYLTPLVAHTQYISASAEGKKRGALDLLFDHLLKEYEDKVRYFDFGKSSDGDGHDLNAPLIFQKEGFGGRGICYDWWEWDLSRV